MHSSVSAEPNILRLQSSENTSTWISRGNVIGPASCLFVQ